MLIYYEDLEGVEEEYEVEGTWVDLRPAKGHDKNGEGQPEEGGYFEDITVFKNGEDVTFSISEELYDKFCEELNSGEAEYDEEDGEDWDA